MVENPLPICKSIEVSVVVRGSASPDRFTCHEVHLAARWLCMVTKKDSGSTLVVEKKYIHLDTLASWFVKEVYT